MGITANFCPLAPPSHVGKTEVTKKCVKKKTVLQHKVKVKVKVITRQFAAGKLSSRHKSNCFLTTDSVPQWLQMLSRKLSISETGC